MLFTGATLFAQSSLPAGPLPAGVQPHPYSSPQDNFKATKIVEAKKDNNGIWYCLVKLEALAIKNHAPNIKFYDAPSFIDAVYFSNYDGTYIHSRPFNNGGYSPNTPGQNEVSKYKSYNQYMPTGEKGFFVWLKANYATDYQIGIIPNPGANSLPTPNIIGGDTFDLCYQIGYTYKSGFPSNIRFGGWLVSLEWFLLPFPIGLTGEPLKIDLVIARPNN